MVHEGHRKRMAEKLVAGELLQEHEQLEMLLFNAYPRKNTNPIAHRLLDAFGSIRGVLEADLKELTAIEGVGENVAAYLKCVAACVKTAYSSDAEEIYLRNYGDFKQFTAKRLRTKTDEVLELYLLERNGRIKYIYSRTDYDKHGVAVRRDELPAIIANVKPFGLLIAHNHMTADSNPSEQDDKFTSEIFMLCNLNGVKLYDHCIYAADNDVYSFFSSGRLDEIKQKFNLDSIMKKI